LLRYKTEPALFQNALQKIILALNGFVHPKLFSPSDHRGLKMFPPACFKSSFCFHPGLQAPAIEMGFVVNVCLNINRL